MTTTFAGSSNSPSSTPRIGDNTADEDQIDENMRGAFYASPAVHQSEDKIKVKDELVPANLVYWLAGMVVFVAALLAAGGSTIVYLLLANTENMTGSCPVPREDTNHFYRNERSIVTSFFAFGPNITIAGSSHVVSFTDIQLNIGDSFNGTNGTFISPSEGVFVFFITLEKRTALGNATGGDNEDQYDVTNDVCCDVLKSGSRVVHMKVDPTDDGTDRGGATITQTVILNLSKFDTVYLEPCDGNQHLEHWSSFSGFLLN